MIADREPEPLSRESSSFTAKALKGVRVLVVDDNEDACELVGLIMEQCGASVTLVWSTLQALEVFYKNPHDILICDIGMPGEDGYSLISRLRARQPEQGGRIPAIALTAFSEPEERTRILLSGFQMYVGKPVEPSGLVAAVCRLSGKFSVKS